jgi:heme/copper-type cytochrome/quinol oxidase subunit 2
MLKSCYRWLAPLALVAVLATVATACPTCKEGLDASDPQHQSAARGFFYSILFMMSMPFAILGTFGSMAYFSIRRAREQQSVASESDGNG